MADNWSHELRRAKGSDCHAARKDIMDEKRKKVRLFSNTKSPSNIISRAIQNSGNANIASVFTYMTKPVVQLEYSETLSILKVKMRIKTKIGRAHV